MSAIDTRTGPERTALLETRELSKVFHARRRGGGSVAVHPTTLRLEQGRCLGIVGESGSGKTTLARMICGLTVPTSGQVDFAGTPVRPRHAAPRCAVAYRWCSRIRTTRSTRGCAC